MYWRIGRRIRQDGRGNERAEYGKEIVQTLSGKSMEEYGRGFGSRNLEQMVRFVEIFPDEWIVNALRAQLSRTGNIELDQAAEAAGVDGNNKQGKLIYDRGSVASHGYRRFLRVLNESVVFYFVPGVS